MEEQGCVGRDHTASPTRAIAHIRGDDEGALATHLHASHTLVPALNHTASTQGKGEGAAAVDRAVELLALALGLARVIEPARVVNHHGLSGNRLGSLANRVVDGGEAGQRQRRKRVGHGGACGDERRRRNNEKISDECVHG